MGRIHEYVRPHYTKFVEDVDPTQLVDRLVNYITKRDKDVILTETRNYGSAAGAGKLVTVIDGKVYEAQLVEALEACGYLELAALLQGRQPPATAAGAPRPGPPPPHPPLGPQSPPPSTSAAVNVTITNMSTGTIAIQHAEPGGTNKFVVEAVPSGSGIEANDSEEAAGTEEEYEVCVQETSPGSQPHTSQTAFCTSSSSPGSEQLYSRYVDERRERTVPNASGLYQQDQVANRQASKPLGQPAGQPADPGHQQGQLFNPGRQDSSPLKSHQQTDGKESPPEHRSRRIGQQVSHTSSQGSPRLDGDDPLQTLGVELRRKSAMSRQESGNVQDTGIGTDVKVPFVHEIETARGAASETGNFHRQSMSSSSAPDDGLELDLRSTASLREMNNARPSVASRSRVGGQRVLDPLDLNVSSLMINSEEFRTRSDHRPASSAADRRDQEKHQQTFPAENLPPDNPQHHPLLPVMVEEMEVSGIDSLVNVDGESSLLSLERCSAGENTRLKSNSPDITTTYFGDVDARTSSHDEAEDTSSTLVSSDNSDALYSNGIDDSLQRCTSGPDLPMAVTDASDAGDRDALQSVCEASSSSPLVPNGVKNHANELSAEMSNHVDVRLLPGSATAAEHRETDINAVNSWWRRGWQSLGELINSG